MRVAKERRVAARSSGPDEHGIVVARVRPGHNASILNVSAGGALIETAHRLLPGSSVELQLTTAQRRASVRGRVLRCTVVRLRASSIWYRGAIVFEQSLPWFAEASAAYHVHGGELRGPWGSREEGAKHLI